MADDTRRQPIPRSGQIVLWVLFALVLTTISLAVLLGRPREDLKSKRFPAARYIRPVNCKLPQIEAGMAISQSCYWPTYELWHDPGKIGLSSNENHAEWIRINNDAVQVRCTFSGCTILSVVKNKFYLPVVGMPAPVDPSAID